MPRWMRRLASIKFNTSCKKHDEDYGETAATRLDADMQFYKNMLEEADRSLFWRAMALFYFNLVRTVGRLRWRKPEEE